MEECSVSDQIQCLHGDQVKHLCLSNALPDRHCSDGGVSRCGCLLRRLDKARVDFRPWYVVRISVVEKETETCAH